MEWSYDIWLYNICVAWLKFVWFRLLDCCLSVRPFACLDDYLPGWLGASSLVCPSMRPSAVYGLCRVPTQWRPKDLWFLICFCRHANVCCIYYVCNNTWGKLGMLLALDQSFYQSKYGHNIKETQFNEFLSFRPGKTFRYFFRMGVVKKHPKICFITANIFCSRTFLLFNNVVFYISKIACNI